MKKTLIIVFALLMAFPVFGLVARADHPRPVTLRLSGFLRAHKTNVDAPLELAIVTSGTAPQATMRSARPVPIGTVKQVFVQVGDRVRKGQVLVSLESTIAQENLSLAEGLASEVSAQIQVLKARIDDLESKKQDARDAERQLLNARATANKTFEEESVRAQRLLAETGRSLAQIRSQLAVARQAGPAAAGQVRRLTVAEAQLVGAIAQGQARLRTGRQLYLAAVAQLESRLTQVREASRQLNEGIEKVEDQLPALSFREKQAQSGVAAAQTIAGTTKVDSPTSGRIASVSLDVGETVFSGQRLLTIDRPNELFLDVYVPQQDIARVRVSQTVSVTVDGAPGRRFSGKVQTITDEAILAPTNVISQEIHLTRVIPVEVVVANEDDFLKPGSPADVAFR